MATERPVIASSPTGTPTGMPRFAWHPRDAAARRADPHGLDGVWWPESRLLSDQLAQLFAAWPPTAGRIMRIGYSPPDWDDRPRVVAVPGRRVKTGGFPDDDTRTLVVTMMDWERFTVGVVPPSSPPDHARALLAHPDDGRP